VRPLPPPPLVILPIETSSISYVQLPRIASMAPPSMSSSPPRPDCSGAILGRRRYPRRVQLASAPLESPPPSPPRCRHPSSSPPPPPRAALPPPPLAPALRRTNPGTHPAHALRCRGHRRIPEPSPTTRLRHPRHPRARGLPGRAHRLFLIRFVPRRSFPLRAIHCLWCDLI
jgi:hypothetical protein